MVAMATSSRFGRDVWGGFYLHPCVYPIYPFHKHTRRERERDFSQYATSIAVAVATLITFVCKWSIDWNAQKRDAAAKNDKIVRCHGERHYFILSLFISNCTDIIAYKHNLGIAQTHTKDDRRWITNLRLIFHMLPPFFFSYDRAGQKRISSFFYFSSCLLDRDNWTKKKQKLNGRIRTIG